MYTSGSTGAPKGVLLSNRNVVATVAGTETLLGELLTDDALYIAFLPASHIFEFTVVRLKASSFERCCRVADFVHHSRL